MTAELSAKDRDFLVKLAKAVEDNTAKIKEHDDILKSLKTNRITLEKTPVGGIQILYSDQIIKQ